MVDTARNWFTCKKCKHRYSWVGAIHPIPPCPKCKPSRTKKGSLTVRGKQRPESVKAAIEQCERIAEGIDELPERAYLEWDPESVKETVSRIEETIRETGRVSENQQKALDNIEQAVSNWLPD